LIFLILETAMIYIKILTHYLPALSTTVTIQGCMGIVLGKWSLQCMLLKDATVTESLTTSPM